MPDSAVQQGEPAQSHTAQEPVPTVAGGAVCRRCWHGVNGLRLDAVCPECGHAVSAAVDPAWWGSRGEAPLAAAAASAGRVCVGAVFVFALLILSMVIQDATRTARRNEALEFTAALIAGAAWITFLSLMVTCALRLGRNRLAPVGLAALFTVVASACAVACIANGLSGGPSPYGQGWLAASTQVLFAVSTITTLLLWAVVLQCAGLRIRHTPLRYTATAQITLGTLLLLAYIPTAAAALGTVAAGTRPAWDSPLQHALGLVMPFVILPLLLLMVINPLLLRSTLRRFLRERKAAM